MPIGDQSNSDEYLYEFFISYSRHDSDLARALAETLQLHGVPVWFAEIKILVEDYERLISDEILGSELQEAMSKSRRCILLASDSALQSKWVMETELQHFQKRSSNNRDMILLVVVGNAGQAVNDFENGALRHHYSVEYLGTESVDELAATLINRVGLSPAIVDAPVGPRSSHLRSQHIVIRTDKRKFGIIFELGTEWVWADKTLPIKVLTYDAIYADCTNSETGMLFNMIVGPMASNITDVGTTKYVDKDANRFATNFVAGKSKWLDETATAPSKREGNLGTWMEFQKMRFTNWLLGLLLRRREILGSHMVNVFGLPHFAFTYRLQPLLGPEKIVRKYSIILLPPGGDRYFEFVVTAAYVGRYEDFLRRIGRVEDIVRSLRLASEREADAQDLFDRGMVHYRNNQYEAAIGAFTEAIELQPEWGMLYFQRGMAYRHLQNLMKAGADLTRATELELSPEMKALSFYNCGVVFEKLANNGEALSAYDSAVKLKPDYSQAWCNRGNILMSLERFEEAHESHSQAIELAPQDYFAFFSRAHCNLSLDRPDAAADDFRAFLRYAPPGHPNRARAHAFLNKYRSDT